MKKSGLSRIVSLYAQVERMRTAELLLAGTALAQAQQDCEQATREVEATTLDGCRALASEDGTDWHLARSLRALAELKVNAAQKALHTSETAERAAQEEHRSSRLQTEQISQVLRHRARAQSGLLTKREQEASDDRYAARLYALRINEG